MIYFIKILNKSKRVLGSVSHFSHILWDVKHDLRRCLYVLVRLMSHVSNIFETWDGQAQTGSVSGLMHVLRLTNWETDQICRYALCPWLRVLCKYKIFNMDNFWLGLKVLPKGYTNLTEFHLKFLMNSTNGNIYFTE